MKKILVVCCCILLSCSIGLTIYLKFKVDDKTLLIKKMNSEKESLTKEIEEFKNNIENGKKELEELKVQLGSKIEEEEVWKQTKEKINQALSS